MPLVIVLSSISPLFVILAILGNNLTMAVMAILPSIFLLLRLGIARRNNDRRSIVIGSARDYGHYIIALGYRVFLIDSPDDGNPLTGRIPYFIITRRTSLSPGEVIYPYRLSNTVYLDLE